MALVTSKEMFRKKFIPSRTSKHSGQRKQSNPQPMSIKQRKTSRIKYRFLVADIAILLSLVAGQEIGQCCKHIHQLAVYLHKALHGP